MTYETYITKTNEIKNAIAAETTKGDAKSYKTLAELHGDLAAIAEAYRPTLETTIARCGIQPTA